MSSESSFCSEVQACGGFLDSLCLIKYTSFYHSAFGPGFYFLSSCFLFFLYFPSPPPPHSPPPPPPPHTYTHAFMIHIQLITTLSLIMTSFQPPLTQQCLLTQHTPNTHHPHTAHPPHPPPVTYIPMHIVGPLLQVLSTGADLAQLQIVSDV